MSIKSPLSHKNQEPEKGVLYVVGTPIGNLSDISLRAIEILKKVSLIFCEDTRQTSKLLQKYQFKNHLISFNKNNYFKKIPIIIDDLKNKKSIALVSDAGMPSICDPGEELIKEIRKIGLKAICIPGPSAALTAIVSSGFPSSKFIFEGFLPKKKKEREEILSEISQNNKTTILFESPHRIIKLLYDLKKYCGGAREIFISRELTKKFEENIGSSINEIIDVFENRNLKLHRQISVQKNTYKSLNRVYVQTLSDMLDMKINYVDEMLELKKTHHNMIFNLSQRIDDLQYKLKDKENEVNMICRVCFTKPIDILINDCNHLIMCSECLEELTNVPNADLLCPLCQTGISGFKKVYLPE